MGKGAAHDQVRKEYLATLERLPDYRVTCILVTRGRRGHGLAALALRGAVELIAQADPARPGRGEGVADLQRVAQVAAAMHQQGLRRSVHA